MGRVLLEVGMPPARGDDDCASADAASLRSLDSP
eukprot:gene45257-55929_t